MSNSESKFKTPYFVKLKGGGGEIRNMIGIDI